ncbi:MAG TPA: tetratricopeptide repeat protein [Acidobacteriaceae bacterium]|nr:tetratricopeptide repeat protein [Acidobacteriaceae bacterium]
MALLSPASSQANGDKADAGRSASGGAPAVLHGRLVLVLPFENHANQPGLDWIGEAAAEVLNRRLAAAGFMPISRDDRLYALNHLGLPQSFQPSRASAIRLAQTLDADYVIVGSFSTDGQRFRASTQVLSMDTLHMTPSLYEEAAMPRLLDVLNSLAWRLAKSLDPEFAVAQNTFVAIDANLKVATFENYIRGLVEPDAPGRIRHLKEAVRLDPTYAPALLALGKAYFADQQYEQAAATLGLLPKDDANAREADFYRGLAYIYLGSYGKAEDAFAFVSQQLPLPEVVNNQGVAASRRGKDATPLFLQAVSADPNDPDYQFNLALALDHKHDVQGALAALAQTLKLRPQDSEAQSLQATLRKQAQSAPAGGRPAAAQAASSDEDAAPLERVKRTFNEASFRQAAFEMEQMEAVRLASLAPAKHAQVLADEGTRYLYQGLILEAEREFQAALQIDSGNAVAHAGLAVVRERGGDVQEARQQAEQSLQLQPNISAYLVLARLDLAANQLPAAAGNVSHALQLEPQNSAARGLRQQLEAKGQQIP